MILEDFFELTLPKSSIAIYTEHDGEWPKTKEEIIKNYPELLDRKVIRVWVNWFDSDIAVLAVMVKGKLK